MRGYDRERLDRPVEQYDDYGYEDDGYRYEDEGDEYEEEEEEAPRRPTKEATEYLELRRLLKEKKRREMKMKMKMKMKEGGSRANLNDRKKLPYDNFGSFFGPSRPVIADRVIQESKSLLETQHLASRVKHLSVHPNKNSSGSTSSGSKPVAHNQKPRVINEQQNKLQKLKNTRDYSFLLSEDAELPAPAKDRPPRSDFAPKSEVRSSPTVANSKQSLPNTGRPVHGSRDNGRSVHGSRDNGRPVHVSRDNGRPVHGSRDNGRPVLGSRDNRGPVQDSRDSRGPVQGSRDNGRPVHSARDERKAVPTNGNMHSKVGSNRPSSAGSRPGSTSMDSRKQLGGNNANGPGRPVGAKGLPSKMPVSTSERRVSAPGLKNYPSLQKAPPSSKSQVKQPVPQRREVRESYKPNMLNHQIRKPQRPTSPEYRPKKRPPSGAADDEYDPHVVSSFIRGMFRYNPNRFSDDSDCSDMEAGFEDIQREERRSAKIGRQEDEEQARLIEEEERRERMAAKRRKLKR